MPPKIYSYYLTGHITTVQYNYITNGNLTTGHMSEEKQKSVYNCEIQRIVFNYKSDHVPPSWRRYSILDKPQDEG